MKPNSERRFSVQQDRSYSGEEINEKTKWANTKVTLVATYTVYESVGSPSYETPVFTGTEKECKQWVENVYKQSVRWSGAYPLFV